MPNAPEKSDPKYPKKPLELGADAEMKMAQMMSAMSTAPKRIQRLFQRGIGSRLVM